MNTPTWIPIVTLVFTILNIFLAAIAIAVNNFLATHREYRKEHRSKVDSIAKRLDELEDITLRFHTSESFDNTEREKILRLITQAKSRIDRLKYTSNQEINISYAKMRSAMADSGATPEEFRQFSLNDEEMLEISRTKERVLLLVEDSFDRHFKLNPKPLIAWLVGWREIH